jgi:hypothetical protein
MLKPGRKSKEKCPAEIHLRLPPEVQEIFNNSGPGKYNEKIINVLKKEAGKHKTISPIEVQAKLIELGKEQRRLTEIETEWRIKLQTIINDDIEFDRALNQVHNAVHPERPI